MPRNFQVTRAVTALIIVTTACHVLFRAFFPSIAAMLQIVLVPEEVLHHGFVWQLVTHLFIQPDVLFLLFMMISLYFIGPIVESALGTARFVGFYLLTGIGGGVAVLLYALYLGRGDFGYYSCLAPVDACCVAFAMIDPDMQVLFSFFIPMRAKWMAIIVAAITIVSGMEGSMGIPMMFSGLGGMSTAWVYWKYLRNLGEGRPRMSRSVQPLRRPNLRVVKSVPSARQLELDEPTPVRPAVNSRMQAEVDAVLDKIRVSGMGSLTPDELRLLGDASRNLRDGQ